MEEFLKDITNWWWWVSVVLLSFLMNLLASYSKPVLDKMFSRIGTTSTKRSDNVSKYVKYYGRSEIKNLELKQDINFQFILVFIFMTISFVSLGFSIQYLNRYDLTSKFIFYCFISFTLLSIVVALVFMKRCNELIKARAIIIRKEKSHL